MKPGDYLTTAELAAKMGWSQRWLHTVIKREGLKPAMVIGRSHLWHRSQMSKLKTRARGRPPKKSKNG